MGRSPPYDMFNASQSCKCVVIELCGFKSVYMFGYDDSDKNDKFPYLIFVMSVSAPDLRKSVPYNCCIDIVCLISDNMSVLS